MRAHHMTPAARLWLRFAVLAAAALALQGMKLLYALLPGDSGTVLYLLHLYGLLPICAFLLAWWAGRGGMHPMAAFFPIGGVELLLPVYQNPVMGFVCMFLSLVGAVAGNEQKRRREGKKKHHGRK